MDSNGQNYPILQDGDMYMEEVSVSSQPLNYDNPTKYAYGRLALPVSSKSYPDGDYQLGYQTPSGSAGANPGYGEVHRAAYAQSLTVPRRQSKKKAGNGMRKPCNCSKSMCLKLYCECFANGEFCRDCNCKDCHNNINYEAERSRAIKQSLEKNPHAFQPKIAVRGKSDAERLHQKGCHCKKSGCLKNYCECYEAKVPCTDRCKCVCCRNTETDRMAKTHLQTPRESGRANSSLLTSGPALGLDQPAQPSDDDSDTEEKKDPKTRPWFYLRDEVIEATSTCLIAQSDELENLVETEEELELGILHEFSSAIRKIIDHSIVAGSMDQNMYA